jgi:hypothetical protein
VLVEARHRARDEAEHAVAVAAPVLLLVARRAESIGSSVNATQAEKIVAPATVSPNSRKNWPTMPPVNATGTKTAQSVAVVASTASVISRVPLLAAVTGSSPRSRCFMMFSRTTIESSIKRPIASESPSSAHHVQREIEHEHEEERAQHRGGQREARDERAPDVEQEHEDDEDRHRAAEEERDLDLVRVLEDELGLIEDQVGLDAVGHLELGEALAHGFRHLHGVRTRGLEDLEDDGRLAVRADDRVEIHVAVLDDRHVAKAHERAVGAVAEGQLAELVDGLQLAERAHRDAPRALVEAAGRARSGSSCGCARPLPAA